MSNFTRKLTKQAKNSNLGQSVNNNINITEEKKYYIDGIEVFFYSEDVLRSRWHNRNVSCHFDESKDYEVMFYFLKEAMRQKTDTPIINGKSPTEFDYESICWFISKYDWSDFFNIEEEPEEDGSYSGKFSCNFSTFIIDCFRTLTPMEQLKLHDFETYVDIEMDPLKVLRCMIMK